MTQPSPTTGPSAKNAIVATHSGQRPTWVYILAHANRERFKLGHTMFLSQRLTALGTAELDHGDCWAAELPTSERAQEIERALHRLLDPYRLRGLCVRDGYTE